MHLGVGCRHAEAKVIDLIADALMDTTVDGSEFREKTTWVGAKPCTLRG